MGNAKTLGKLLHFHILPYPLMKKKKKTSVKYITFLGYKVY